MNNEERIQQLERQVQDLLQWKSAKERQQLTFPLDDASKNVIGVDFFRVMYDINYTRPSGREVPLYVVARAKSKDYFLTSNPVLYTFSAATSDVITINTSVPIIDDIQVILFSSQTMPAGLTADTIYYTINSSGNTCKLSLTSGGAAENITDAGLGTHYLYFA